MKKIIIGIAVFCLITTAIKAQGFAIGLKAGANANKITGISFKDEYKLSYQAGAFMEIDINKKIGFQPEVLFSQSQGTTTSTVMVPSQNYSLNYLNIPILLRYKIGKIVVLNVGPQYSILLNKDNTLVVNGKNAIKDGDFAMVAGLQLGFKYLRFYGRYNVGLNNLNDFSNLENWKSEQIQVGVGFKF